MSFMRSLSLIATAALALVLAVSASATRLPGERVGHAGLAQGASAFATASASLRRPRQLWLRVEGRVESVLGRVKCSDSRGAPIVKFAPGLYRLPIPGHAAGVCEVFADANGSGHIFVEVRAS